MIDYRAAVPALKTAKAAWQSESRVESYLAVLAGSVGLILIGRETWRFRAIWTENN